MIGGRPRERQPERDVHRSTECGDLYCGHPYIMIRRDHSIEFTAHRPNEHSVSRKWAEDPSATRRWSEQPLVLVSEAAAITRVRVQRTERDLR
jgi:hypothetical protein